MSKIQIDLESDNSKPINDVGAIDQKLKDLSRSAQAVAKESERGANQTAGSYARLRGELASNKKALEALEVGSDAFREQAAVVQELEGKVKSAKNAIAEAVSTGEEFDNVAAAVQVADNSIEKLERDLKEATAELKRLERGTPAYEKQAKVVSKLSAELDDANKELKDFTRQKTGVDAVEGSLARLEDELSKNVAKLRQLKVGTSEFNRQKQVVDKLAVSVRNAQGAIGQSGHSSRVGAAVKDFAVSVAGFTTLTGGLVAAANLLKSELEQVNRQDKESTAAVRTREQSIAALVQNAGGELTDRIVERAEATGGLTGADVDKLLSISSSVASAGVTDPQEIVDIAQTALRSQGGDAGKGAAIAGAAIDLGNTLGISVKEAFGVLFQTAGAARPEDIALLGKAAVRATAALTNAGVRAEEAQEIFAASTLLTGDKTGEQSVSIANDLTQAFRKFQQEGIPDTIKVGGEDVDVNIPPKFRDLLKGEGLKQLTLDDLLDLSRQSKEIEQVVESFLPNSQNRAFTSQIVGGSKVFDEKLKQAASAVDLISAGKRADQQVADVEGRRVVGVLAEQVDAILDRNKQDQSAALQGLARETFEAIQQRTDIQGFDAIQERLQNAGALARERFGEGAAGARANVLNALVNDGSFVGKDRETAEAGVAILQKIQSLADAAEAGGLSSRQANSELAQLREVLKGILSNSEQQRQLAERQAQLLEAAAANRPQVQEVRVQNAGPVEAPPAAAGVP